MVLALLNLKDILPEFHMWDIVVTRIGQLASEMRLSTGGQSVGGSNGNADELINWNGTKKRGLGI